MRAKSTGFLTGMAGALIGAVSMHLINGDRTPTAADELGNELVALHERMNQTEALLREIRTHISASETIRQSMPTVRIEKPITNTSSVDAAALSEHAEKSVTRDMAVEEAIIANIITRLYDPAYTNSTTMAEVMQSEEMLELSDESRERVVAEMVGMLNRGEIDAETFFFGGPAQ